MTDCVTVLVVDDSALMRVMINDMLSTDEKIKVIGTAQDGLEAILKAKTMQPDVVTMDIEMPEVDGIKALRTIMRDTPTRVVMLTGLNRPGLAYEALRFGAVDFINKPSGPISKDFRTLTGELLRKVRLAAHVDPQKLTMGEIMPAKISQVERTKTIFAKVVAIGSSTGGPQALEKVFRRLPPDFPAAILIVQHLPAGYSQALAERLTHAGNIPVKEAVDGDPIIAGRALIAPGGQHMVVSRAGNGKHVVMLKTGPPINHIRPSVDELMFSVANIYGNRSVGVIMSGMGTDGADGMEQIKRAGGRTIVQDEETSVVFGMPGATIRRRLADKILPVDQMAPAITESLTSAEKQYEKL